jgi:tRNA(Ile)-lysidine synthase
VKATLLTVVRRALLGEAKVAPDSTLLVAVSGGTDSMALLHVLARLAPKQRLLLHAHGVDHGLRAAAKTELDNAEAFALHLGVPFSRTELHVEKGGNLQARARAARYSALERAANACGATAIATAHHADDRAETVLLRLLRGAGPRGLAVLTARTPLAQTDIALIRPMLRARKTTIVEHLTRHGIPFAEDPSNLDPRFLRVRVRRELLPLLADLSPGIVEHLTALADQLAVSADESAASYAIPRATQTALRELAKSRSKVARVWLPGGLVAMVDDRARPAT